MKANSTLTLRPKINKSFLYVIVESDGENVWWGYICFQVLSKKSNEWFYRAFRETCHCELGIEAFPNPYLPSVWD